MKTNAQILRECLAKNGWMDDYGSPLTSAEGPPGTSFNIVGMSLNWEYVKLEYKETFRIEFWKLSTILNWIKANPVVKTTEKEGTMANRSNTEILRKVLVENGWLEEGQSLLPAFGPPTALFSLLNVHQLNVGNVRVLNSLTRASRVMRLDDFLQYVVDHPNTLVPKEGESERVEKAERASGGTNPIELRDCLVNHGWLREGHPVAESRGPAKVSFNVVGLSLNWDYVVVKYKASGVAAHWRPNAFYEFVAKHPVAKPVKETEDKSANFNYKATLVAVRKQLVKYGWAEEKAVSFYNATSPTSIYKYRGLKTKPVAVEVGYYDDTLVCLRDPDWFMQYVKDNPNWEALKERKQSKLDQLYKLGKEIREIPMEGN